MVLVRGSAELSSNEPHHQLLCVLPSSPRKLDGISCIFCSGRVIPPAEQLLRKERTVWRDSERGTRPNELY